LFLSDTNCATIDKAISGADFPPILIPIGPCIELISLSLNPKSFNLLHLFSWVFLLPRAPI